MKSKPYLTLLITTVAHNINVNPRILDLTHNGQFHVVVRMPLGHGYRQHKMKRAEIGFDDLALPDHFNFWP